MRHGARYIGHDGPPRARDVPAGPSTGRDRTHRLLVRQTVAEAHQLPADPATHDAPLVALAHQEARAAQPCLALTRQGLPTLRTEHTDENLSARGGYVLADVEGKRQATILATGSEGSIAMDACAKLRADGIATAVVSMPSWELFEAQSEAYRRVVLGETGVRVAIEAASTFGWERYVGPKGGVVGMTSFGASAPDAANAGTFARSSPSRKSSVPSPSRSLTNAFPVRPGRSHVRAPRL